jgi:aromatic ring-opening dioxygenase LigB subunit
MTDGESDSVGEKFDREFIKLVESNNKNGLLKMDETFVESAGECGYHSALVLFGALEGSSYKPAIYSYEGPFGVGYMVANMGVKEDL